MTSLILGIVLLIGGISLWYLINRRRFNRRNFAGLEEFSSYEKSWFVTFLERIGKLVALALVIFGCLFLWAYCTEKKNIENAKARKQQIQQTNEE